MTELDHAHAHFRAETCPRICEACSAREASICGVLPHPELRQLADCAAVDQFEAGKEFVHQGDVFDHVFNITDGVAMTFTELSDGRRQVLGFLFRGDFLGLGSGAQYDFGVRALTPLKVCRFARPAFRRLLLELPTLEAELLSRASSELQSARTHLTLLGRKTAMERVASFLLLLADQQARLGQAPDRLVLPMTRTDIADYLGLTIETVSRAISALKKRGAIELVTASELRLVQRRRLAELAEG